LLLPDGVPPKSFVTVITAGEAMEIVAVPPSNPVQVVK
jgi:hypothetical protein